MTLSATSSAIASEEVAAGDGAFLQHQVECIRGQASTELLLSLNLILQPHLNIRGTSRDLPHLTGGRVGTVCG